MQREGIDLWIVVGSEYNEDPVFDSLTPASTLNASRRMVLVFHLRGDGNGPLHGSLSLYRTPPL